MHMERIFVQENFRRCPGDDPFLYGNIGVGIFINAGESTEEAEQVAKEYIAGYIKRNTVYPEHNHIEERIISELKVLPVISVEKEDEYIGKSMEEMLMSCTEFTVLESYRLIVKNNPEWQRVYDIKRAQLVDKESKEIISQTEALCGKK